MSATEKRRFDAGSFLRTLTTRPGVYRMLDTDGQMLYVGKAGNLKNRLSNHFRGSSTSAKNRLMLEKVADVEITVTQTEAEALLLENQLIKSHRPRYNVLLRDDKSYPYIHLSSQDEYPRLTFYRGSTSGPGDYFGPYPSVTAVRSTLDLMQKLFRIRNCTDSYFRNRSRPCLQYQIERCTAPCVGYIEREDYRRDVEHARLFLQGREQQVVDALAQQMEEAAGNLDYERAARLRDRIRAIRQVQERQHVAGLRGDLDVVACSSRGGQSCVQIFFVRDGRNLGNKVFHPRTPDEAGESEVLYAVLTQFYLAHEVPPEILLSHDIEGREALAEVLRERSGRRVRLTARPRGERRRWLDMARANANEALAARLASRSGMAARLDALTDLLGLESPPGRMEGFDVSHTRGEAAVASCVVFGPEGPLKNEYRRFNIEDITPGDDYAAMRQAIERRYTRLRREERSLPDVVFIDGGKGQLAQGKEVMDELQIAPEQVLLVGIAKGPERRPGMETLFVGDAEHEIHLAADSPGLHLIQQIRDEAHRFAVSGHRGARGRTRRHSVLEDIPGLGPRRRAQLLRHFGGLQGVRRAGVEDLAAVPGISTRLARMIYDVTHGSASGGSE